MVILHNNVEAVLPNAFEGTDVEIIIFVRNGNSAPASAYILVNDGTTYVITKTKMAIAKIINTDGYVMALIICFLFVSCCL